jgi:uncharacterized protein
LIRISGCNFIRGSISLRKPGRKPSSADHFGGHAESFESTFELLFQATEMQHDFSDAPLPAYTYVPGGPWPHPKRVLEEQATGGSACGNDHSGTQGSWWQARFRRAAELFNAGYYWEAHEVWEELWHAEGRRGPTAEVLKGLIKLAAAGVKVREGRENGVRTHCRRAAESFAAAAGQGGPCQLGQNLELWADRARLLAENPPQDPGLAGAAVTRVFDFVIDPKSSEPAGE